MQLKNKYFFLAAALLFVTCCIAVFLKFRQYYSPDAISYIAITEKIMQGRFYASVNGYWSPLLSWLLVPVQFLVKDGITGLQLLQIIFSVFILYNCYRILQLYCKNILLIRATLSGLCILLPVLALTNLTADLLSTGLLLQYVYLLATEKNNDSWFKIAIMGFLLFLAKTYCLYFFIAHQILYRFYQSRTAAKPLFGQQIKQWTLFIMLCSCWTAVLSKKYGSFTISTASRYNSALLTTDNKIIHPCDSLKMLPPAATESYTAWEEMYLHTKTIIDQKKKSPYYFSKTEKNSFQVIKFLNKVPRYGLLIFAGLLMAALLTRRSLLKPFIPLLMLLVYPAGYLFLFIEERYLFFPTLLLSLLNTILPGLYLRNKIFQLFMVLLLLYSLIRPAIDSYLFFPVSEEKISVRVASQTRSTNNTEVHYATYQPYQFATIAYMNKWKNYGGIKNYRYDSSLLQKDLENYSIDYLLLPDSFLLPENISGSFTDLQLKDIGTNRLWKRN
jgi:hypothetical protein